MGLLMPRMLDAFVRMQKVMYLHLLNLKFQTKYQNPYQRTLSFLSVYEDFLSREGHSHMVVHGSPGIIYGRKER